MEKIILMSTNDNILKNLFKSKHISEELKKKLFGIIIVYFFVTLDHGH